MIGRINIRSDKWNKRRHERGRDKDSVTRGKGVTISCINKTKEKEQLGR